MACYRGIAGLGAAGVLAGVGLVATAGAALAGTVTTLTNPTTLSGSQTISSTGVTATGAGVTATFDLQTSLTWSQSTSIGATFDSNLLRQGRALNPSDSYTRNGTGSMAVTWTLAGLNVSWDSI